MGKGQGMGASGARMTRREVLAAGAAALVAGLGFVGCANAAVGAGDSAASDSGSASGGAGGQAGSVAASGSGGGQASSPSAASGTSGGTKASTSTSSGAGSSSATASASKGSSGAAGSTKAGASTSAESNKARKFREIPADALISVDELHDLFEAGDVKDRKVYVIDIRSHRDYQNQLIEGSRNIPAGRQIEIRMGEIPQDKQVVLVALKNSNRLAETYFTLMANGYDPDLVRVLDGGVKAWVDAGYPTLEDQFLGC